MTGTKRYTVRSWSLPQALSTNCLVKCSQNTKTLCVLGVCVQMHAPLWLVSSIPSREKHGCAASRRLVESEPPSPLSLSLFLCMCLSLSLTHTFSLPLRLSVWACQFWSFFPHHIGPWSGDLARSSPLLHRAAAAFSSAAATCGHNRTSSLVCRGRGARLKVSLYQNTRLTSCRDTCVSQLRLWSLHKVCRWCSCRCCAATFSCLNRIRENQLQNTCWFTATLHFLFFLPASR